MHGLSKSSIMVSLLGATDWNTVECLNLGGTCGLRLSLCTDT